MPLELVYYLNTTKSLCSKCKVPNSVSHLQSQHNCILPDLQTLLKKTYPIQEAKSSRRQGIEKIRCILQPLLSKLKLCIGETLLRT